MKKIILVLSVLLLLPGLSQAQVAVPTLYTTTNKITVDSLIQAEGSTAVYYLASDNKRYVFPNEKTFSTWYADFSEVQVVSLTELQNYMIGGNVTYRPGTRLVKITTDPKTYAVEPGGVLRWITSEQVAKDLYGDNWAQRIDDVPDPFFVNYTVSGDNVDSAEHPVGSLISYSDSDNVYLIDIVNKTKVRRNVMSLNSNRHRLEFVIQGVSPSLAYALGGDVVSVENRLTDPTTDPVNVVPAPEPTPEPGPVLPDLAESRVVVDPRVSATGDGSVGAPYKTLAEGVANLTPGRTLYLRGNESGLVYTEALPIVGDGSSGSEKNIQAFPDEKVILALPSTLQIDEDYWIFKDLIFDNQNSSLNAIEVSGRYNKLDGVEVMNGTGDGIKIVEATTNTVITGARLHDFRDCVLLTPHADNVTVSNSTLYNCSSDAIEVTAESGTPFANLARSVTILGNDIYTSINSETGINIEGAVGGIISINQIHGFASGQAIRITNLAHSITISDNEIYNNDRGIEIRVAVNTPRAMDIYNNVIYDITGDYAMRFDGVDGGLRIIHNTLVDIANSAFKVENLGISSGQIINNLISNAGTNIVEPGSQKAVVLHNGWFAGAKAGTIGGASNTEGDDAMFVDSNNDIYSLQPGSPAVDAGTELGYIDTDFNGSPREVGANPDLGAYELQ